MYILIFFIFFFLLGIIIGSFLNVIIYRFNTGKTIVRGHSMCMNCGRKLRWYELIPLVSYLIQLGKCRRCRSSVSVQYPVVEFLTGLMFLFIAFHFLPIILFSPYSYLVIIVLFFIIFSILIIISVYDFRHKVIPDKMVYLFAFVSLLSIFVNQTPFGPILVWPSLSHIISGPVLALPFALIWLFSHGRLMGLGDAKLILGIGWMLGLSQGLASLAISFLIGAIISLIVMALSPKKVNMQTQIPFAPFLILGAVIVFIFNIDILTFGKLFSF